MDDRDVGTTSATLPRAVLDALRTVAALTKTTQSQIITEALLQDARIALEMRLRARVVEWETEDTAR